MIWFHDHHSMAHYFQISYWMPTLMLGNIEGRRRRGRRRMRWLDGITNSKEWVWVNSGSWWWTGRPGVQRIGHDLRDWTELNPKSGIFPDARITLVNRFNLCLMEFTNQWRKCWTNDERNEEHTLGGPVVIWSSGKTSGRSDSDQKHK